MFKTWMQTPVLARLMTPGDKAMSETMSACWASFAKAGKPSCGPAPVWPAYDLKTDLQMEFSLNTQVVKPARAAAFDVIIEQALTSGR